MSSSLRTKGSPVEPSTPTGADGSTMLIAQGLRKTYPGTQALKGVSLQLLRGEVRGLVGENGSGKSTLVGILAGKTVPDPGGRVDVAGRPLTFGDPRVPRGLGIAVIHQELLIVPGLSALENVFLGDLQHRGGFITRERMRREYAQLAESMHIEIDPAAPAGSLSVAQQTLLEMMRAIRRQARLLVMDEPTATLGPTEREKLYEIVGDLRARGVTCVLISHDLDEVLRLCDSVSVFKDGRHVRTDVRARWTKNELVAAMLSEERAEEVVAAGGVEDDAVTSLRRAVGLSGTDGQAPPRRGHELLSVRRVQAGKVAVEELRVHAGEIVGIAGLVGSGRSSLLRAMAGAMPKVSGDMRVRGAVVQWPRTVAEALEQGIALMPEDRKNHGLLLEMSAYDNVTMADLTSVARGGFLSRRRSTKRAAELLERVGFRGRIAEPVRNLSGGNQQKVMLAKWLHRGPQVLMIDEPTRGVDVGAKVEIMRILRDLADEGRGVIWVSSELEEVVSVSDRVVLMSDGRIAGELAPPHATLPAVLAGLFKTAPGATDDLPEGEEPVTA